MTNMPSSNNSFSEQILQTGFDMSGLHLIEASAGTGKTYSLQTVFLRLLLEKNIPIEQIVVVTFTVAAAKDLKKRLRQILQSALNIAQNPEAKEDKDYERVSALLNLLNDPVQAKRILQRALLDFDLAAILTIHGFCHRLLTRYAFQAGLSLDSLELGAGQERIARLCRDWIRRHHYPGTADHAKEINKVFTYENLLALSSKLIAKSNLHLDLVDEGLAQAARAVKEAHDEEARLNEQLSYDGLLANLYRALHDPKKGALLRQSIGNEFQAALIDEFQDTDPLQWKIFESLFVQPGQERPCFIVGDPKQAIYSFRGGDIRTYLKVSNKVDEQNRHQLKRNYRSEEGYIEAINEIFADQGDERAFLHEQIRYASNLEAEGLAGAKALKVNSEIDPRPLKWIIKDAASTIAQPAEINSAYAQTALEIYHLLQDENTSIAGEPVAPGQIAVLCRTNDGCKAVLKALNQLNIPAVRLKGQNVWSSDEAKSFLELLYAIARPFSRNHIYAFMLGTWGALKRELLMPWQENKIPLPYAAQLCRRLANRAEVENESELAYEQVLETFQNLQELWHTLGFSSCCQAALQVFDLPVRLLQEEQGEQKLANLKQIIELTQQKLSEQRLSPEELLTWLQQSIVESKKDREGKEGSEARKASDNPAVQVMTIHGSKGLEFPIVFVPEMHHKAGGGSQGPIEAHDKEGRLQAGIAPPKEEKNPYFTELQNQYKQEQLEEHRRLTYVALTRAIHGCRILYDGSRGNNCDYFLPEKAALPDSLLDKQPSDWKQKLTDLAWQGEAPPPLQAPPPRPVLKRKNLISSFSAFAPSTQAPGLQILPQIYEHESEADNDPPEMLLSDAQETEEIADIFAFPAGERTGNCWHEIFEQLSFDADEEQIKNQVQASLQDYGFAGGKYGAERLCAVSDMVQNTLNYPLPALANAGVFSLNKLESRKCIKEWEFFFTAKPELNSEALKEAIRKDAAHRGFIEDLATRSWNRTLIEGAMTGYIDLWFEHQGRYYILDWKSNRIQGKPQNFAVNELHGEMSRQRYWLQYLFYTVALNRFLQENLRDYSYEKNFGGVYYLFLRGLDQEGQRGVYACRPAPSLVQELSELLIN